MGSVIGDRPTQPRLRMNAYLLDTHVIVWLATSPELIPASVRGALERAEQLYVSAASGYEIAQKGRVGKLPQADVLLARWSELLDTAMATELPLTVQEAIRAGSMPWQHRDPFDRMLVAQAQLRGLTLVTKDDTVKTLPELSYLTWA